jgi:DNA-binding NarL/FixJ family response regulator
MSQLLEFGELEGATPELREQPARVLIVDDDVLALRMLERSLKSQGYETVTARSVEEACELIEEQAFDAALVDAVLGEGQGSDVVARLRACASPCCAVMVTGSSRSELVREARFAGAEEFLLKPVGELALVDAVKRSVDQTKRWRASFENMECKSPECLPPTLNVVTECDWAEETPFPRNNKKDALTRLIAWPPLPTLGVLDIDRCADALARIGNLTDKERNLLVPLLRGEQNHEIAQHVGLAHRTVKFHVSNILKKLRVQQRSELIRFFF